jgi:integrase
MGKKANGEGSIYLIKTGKNKGLYGASITLENGKRRYFYGKKRQDVYEKMQVALRKKQQGTLVDASQQTVEQYLQQWLEHSAKDHIRPRTYERYEQYVRLHIIPMLGKIKLQALSPQQLQTWKSKKLKEGLSPTTVRTMHIVLHKALSDAIKLGLVTRNVCEMVSPPRKARQEMQVLSADQARTFLAAAVGEPDEALFIMALATGMRRGELLGLKWQDISFQESVLCVRRTLNRVPTVLGEGAGSLVESEPKTAQSRRSIVPPGFAIEALQRQKELQAGWKKNADTAWEEHGYVFTTQLGRYIHPNSLYRHFKELLKKAGLPDIRFHDLRHSVASLLLSSGIHPKVVQEILGHSQISMTMDIYSHVLPTMHQDAMDKLNQAFTNDGSTKAKNNNDGENAGGVLAPV